MKKIFVILLVLITLLGASGCTSRRTYKTEDYEVNELIKDLEGLKRDGEDDGVYVDYEVIRRTDGKYVLKLHFEFNEHDSDWKTIPITVEELREGFNSNVTIDDIFDFKVDGVKYDYETAMMLLEYYSDSQFFN